MNILMYGDIASRNLQNLKSRVDPSWQIEIWDPTSHSPEDFIEMISQAQVLVGGPIPTDTWPDAPKLRLCQVPWAGYDWARPDNIPNGVPFCNCYEHEGPIAEYVLLTMLESRIGLRRMDGNFRARGWDGHGPGNSVFHGELAGATLGIVGYGHIGEQVALRAKAFGVRMLGVRRSEQETPPLLDWLGTDSRRDELLAESDFVLIACDLNEQTRGMVDQSFLRKMKPQAWIINVARGAIIDEDALFHALKSQTIGGAIIDTWYNYPSRNQPDAWPSNHPFHELDNTIVSAHESGWTHELVERRWQVVADNLARLHNDQPLQNLLFTGSAQVGDSSR